MPGTPTFQDVLDMQLIDAAEAGNTELLRDKIKEGGDPNRFQGNALRAAAKRGHVAVAKVLQAHDAVEPWKNAAMTEAAAAGHSEFVRYLIAHGADVMHNDSAALLAAVDNNRLQVVKALLDSGADVDARHGTLLCQAISHGRADIARLFIAHGADPRRLWNGKNAYQYAEETGMRGLVEEMQDFQSDTDFGGAAWFAQQKPEDLTAEMENRSGRTGLHLAARAGCFESVTEAFLKAGAPLKTADLLKKTQGGDTVLALLADTGELAKAFNAKTWEGRKDEMLALYKTLPEKHREQVDLKTLAAAIDRLELKSKSVKFKLK
jgi:ankyrin repeat protein